MKYIAVRWIHQDPRYPIMLYSEVDDAGWEVRKVEAYADGRIGYADKVSSRGDTGLSIEPLPPLEQIAADPQFEPWEISKGGSRGCGLNAAGRDYCDVVAGHDRHAKAPTSHHAMRLAVSQGHLADELVVGVDDPGGICSLAGIADIENRQS